MLTLQDAIRSFMIQTAKIALGTISYVNPIIRRIQSHLHDTMQCLNDSMTVKFNSLNSVY